MGWQELTTGNAIDIKKEPNEPHIGTFMGKKDITTKIGPQVIWQFNNEEGNFGIYGFTNLNRIMETVQEGTTLQITYKGTQRLPTKFGIKDVHQVHICKWTDDEKKNDSLDNTPF